jgi:hypothetical protein
MPDEAVELIVAGVAEWRAWLRAHVEEQAGVWSGRMHPAGGAEVERAKADGRWPE